MPEGYEALWANWEAYKASQEALDAQSPDSGIPFEPCEQPEK